jgi:TM2 domain-containing membrane protein YozV
MPRHYDDDDDDDRPSKRRRRDDDDDDSDLEDDDRRRTRRGRGGWDTQRGRGEESKRMIAGLFGILLGGFGIHKFVLGYSGEGAIMLSLALIGSVLGGGGGVFCCIPAVLLIMPCVTGIIGLIEGIIYLSKSDAEFIETYQIGRRPWF